MAVDTVYENPHTISPRLNKQYTTVATLGRVTVLLLLYDMWKEWLWTCRSHQNFRKIYKPPPPPHTHTKKSFQTKPVCQSLWVKKLLPLSLSEWSTLHSLSGKSFFSVCNQEIQIFLRYVWWWGPEEHASFLCMKNWIGTWFSAWHTSRTCKSYRK